MPSAQTDRFVHDRLPLRASWPTFRYELPELQALPESLNVVAHLFDRAERQGWRVDVLSTSEYRTRMVPSSQAMVLPSRLTV